MRNLLNIDTRKSPYELNYTNCECASNTIELLIYIENITSPYLEFTKVDGSIVNSDVLTPIDNYISYNIPFSYYSTSGTLKVRVRGTDYDSNYIEFTIQKNIVSTDNVMVKIDSGKYLIRIIAPYKYHDLPIASKTSLGGIIVGSNLSISPAGVLSATGGGSGGTSDYHDLTNKPTINGVELSGNKSTSDLGIDIPTKISELTNDSGYLTNYTETDPVFSASASSNITSNDITNWNNKSDFSGNYNDLTNKPTIPNYTGGNGISISSDNEISVTNPLPLGLRLFHYDIGNKTIEEIQNDSTFTQLCYYISSTFWDNILVLYNSQDTLDTSTKNIMGIYQKTKHELLETGQGASTLTQINDNTFMTLYSDEDTNKMIINNVNPTTIDIVESDVGSDAEVTINVGGDNSNVFPTTDYVDSAIDNVSADLNAYIPKTSIGVHSGVASLDENGKVPSSQLPSGTSDYNDLTNKPTINGVELSGNKSSSDLGIDIPTKTSELTNDSGFVTSDYHDSTKQNTLTAGTNITIDENNVISATGGGSGGTSDYNDLTNKPVINITNEDNSNPTCLYDLDEGIYKIYGYIKFYPTDTGTTAITSPTLISISKSSTTTYVQMFEPYGNKVTGYEITSSNYIKTVNGFGYDIGDVIITSTNTDPSTTYGGTWKLIDKEFSSASGSNNAHTNNTTNTTNATVNWSRAGHTINLEIGITNKVQIKDADLVFVTLKKDVLGVTNLPHTIDFCGYTDAGNCMVMFHIHYSNGNVYSCDIIPDSYVSVDNWVDGFVSFVVPQNLMLDSACNKFYWKKTA